MSKDHSKPKSTRLIERESKPKLAFEIEPEPKLPALIDPKPAQLNKLSDDLLVGASAIAVFLYGAGKDPAKKRRRKIYGLMESHEKRRKEGQALPFFRMGREICARKSTLQKWVAAREAGGDEAQ